MASRELYNRKFADEIIGQKFGMLTVLDFIPKEKRDNPRKNILCRCDCGNVIAVRKDLILSGRRKSCGCYQQQISKDGITKKHGLYKERIYWVYCKIKSRCYNKNCREYDNYGGRGIKICDEWLYSVEKFAEWSYANGYDKDAPKGQCTIDRIDVNKDYSPDNCRWITNKKQQNNRRDNRLFEYDGEVHTIAEWSEILNIKYSTLNAGLVRYNKPLSYYVNEYTPRK